MLDKFEAHLRRENLSENTISSYLLTIRMYQQLSGEITKQNLLAFKGYLIETYKPKTVNLRIQAINKYLDFIKKEKLLPETRRKLGMVFCSTLLGCNGRAGERTDTNQGGTRL